MSETNTVVPTNISPEVVSEMFDQLGHLYELFLEDAHCLCGVEVHESIKCPRCKTAAILAKAEGRE